MPCDSSSAGETSLNRYPDYLHTLFVPDRARTAFPLFDQPDLKAVWELTLAIPREWVAVANAPVEERITGEEQVEYRFAPTEPLSSYLFAFAAGRFQAVARTVDGLPMTLYHRETDGARLERNLDAIFGTHGDALAWLEDYTGVDYPFHQFDFVLIPTFPYGGMEHPGAIFYRAAHLLLEESPPPTRLPERAQLIAHETAHMWFGNLVTMRWFDDVWTKEVCAGFMADRIVNNGFPDIDHDLAFLLGHHPGAYAVDRSAGANPIRQPLANLDQAGQLYGGAIYDKAPIMLRQLELVTGADRFRTGLRDYLRRFAFGNATWPELVAILDRGTDLDLAAWSRVWVETEGRPIFEITAGDGAGGTLPWLQQRDPAGRGRLWPQRFTLLPAPPGDYPPVTLEADRRRIPMPAPGGDGSQPLLNADGRGYGLFPVQPGLFDAWSRLPAVNRGALLVDGWENLVDGALGDPLDYLGVLGADRRAGAGSAAVAGGPVAAVPDLPRADRRPAQGGMDRKGGTVAVARRHRTCRQPPQAAFFRGVRRSGLLAGGPAAPVPPLVAGGDPGGRGTGRGRLHRTGGSAGDRPAGASGRDRGGAFSPGTQRHAIRPVSGRAPSRCGAAAGGGSTPHPPLPTIGQGPGTPAP
jgi:aminopeptidase N